MNAIELALRRDGMNPRIARLSVLNRPGLGPAVALPPQLSLLSRLSY